MAGERTIPDGTLIHPASAIEIAGLEPVRTIRRRWPMMLGVVLTVAMVAGLGRELLGSGLAGLARAVPGDPRFYLFFALLYLAFPVADFVIFRRLWRIPLSGFVALNKKRVANDVVLGYSGEAYFYAWARARAAMVAAPFGAVKDVAVLSGVAGTAVTIALCLIALPFGHQLLPPAILKAVLGSAAIMLAVTVLILAFSRRVFSLRTPALWWIFGVHVARLVMSSIFVALCWHYAMPQVSIGTWLFLSAGRLLVARLPFVPNKDLLFANFAILLIGQDRALSEMIAFVAALTLLAHVMVIAAIGLGQAWTGWQAWRAR